MTLIETIHIHAQSLPPALQRETLDFITWLEMRYRIPSPVDAMRSADTEAFITRHVGALSPDFPADIDDGDLGEDVPRDVLK